MQVIKQLEDVQKTILNLENSKNYYKKQFEASIKDNEILQKQIEKLTRAFLVTIICTFAIASAFFYLLLLSK